MNSWKFDSKTTTSIKDEIHKRQVISKEKQEKIFTPSYPNFLPNNPQKIELIKGNNIISIYINVGLRN